MARQPHHLVEQQQTLGRYLAAFREAAGRYQVDIARAVPCHRTTVAHAEAGSQLPDSYFWEKADQVVGANGALLSVYDDLIQAKAAYAAEQQVARRARASATVQCLTDSLGVRGDQVSNKKTPNHLLAAVMSEARVSNKGLAARVRALAQRDGNPISSDHVSVRRWLDGSMPRGRTSQYIAAALGAKLGRQVKPAELGLIDTNAMHEAEINASSGYLYLASQTRMPTSGPTSTKNDGREGREILVGTLGSGAQPSTYNLESILIEAAGYSANFLPWAEASNVGELTIEQLHIEIRRIAASYLKVPTLPLFLRTCGLRDRVFSLLGGHQRPAHSRELYSAAGWCLTILAWISTDFNHPNSVEEHLRTAWVCAENSDQDSLRAWIRATQHTAAFWQNDFIRAGKYAKDGLRYATSGTAELFLTSAWALDMARYGDHDGARRVVADAQRLSERVNSDIDEVRGPFTCSIDRAGGFWSDTYLNLGDAEKSLSSANVAVSNFERTPSAQRNLGSERMVRCQQVKAHLMLGELDGAWESLSPILGTSRQHRMQPLTKRVHEISEMVTSYQRDHSPLISRIRDAATDFGGSGPSKSLTS